MIMHQVQNSYSNYNYNTYIYSNICLSAHFHKNYELIYVLKGDAEVYMNSIPYRLETGEMLLVSPYTVHSFSVSSSSRIWVGVFAEDYISGFAKKNSSLQYSKFRCSEKVDDFLKEHLVFQGQPSLNMAKGCLYIMCNECIENASVVNSGADTDFKGKVIAFISKNLSDEISLAKASRSLGYEYHYFSNLFHQYFEMNFKEFVNIFRIEYANEWLRDTTKDIAYVAAECGFQSIRNFNRVFKKFNGKTPSEYRKGLK